MYSTGKTKQHKTSAFGGRWIHTIWTDLKGFTSCRRLAADQKKKKKTYLGHHKEQFLPISNQSVLADWGPYSIHGHL